MEESRDGSLNKKSGSLPKILRAKKRLVKPKSIPTIYKLNNKIILKPIKHLKHTTQNWNTLWQTSHKDSSQQFTLENASACVLSGQVWGLFLLQPVTCGSDHHNHQLSEVNAGTAPCSQSSETKHRQRGCCVLEGHSSLLQLCFGKTNFD